MTTKQINSIKNIEDYRNVIMEEYETIAKHDLAVLLDTLINSINKNADKITAHKIIDRTVDIMEHITLRSYELDLMAESVSAELSEDKANNKELKIYMIKDITTNEILDYAYNIMDAVKIKKLYANIDYARYNIHTDNNYKVELLNSSYSKVKEIASSIK